MGRPRKIAPDGHEKRADKVPPSGVKGKRAKAKPESAAAKVARTAAVYGGTTTAPRVKARQEHNRTVFLQALARNRGHVSNTCRETGVPRRTVYHWIEDPVFAEAVDLVSETLLDDAELQLQNKIESGDITALIFFLKTKGKRRGYIERQEIDHGGRVDLKLEVTFV